jgi:hypothetical protein
VHEEQFTPILVHYRLAIRSMPNGEPVNVKYLTHAFLSYAEAVDLLSSLTFATSRPL